MHMEGSASPVLDPFRNDLAGTGRSETAAESGANSQSSLHGILSSSMSKKVLESLDSAKQVVKIPEGVMRPKAEQDLVGFGLREMMGLPSHKMIYPSTETQMVFYATNRKVEGQDDHGSDFGKTVDSSTHFGLAEIQCPGGKPLVHRDFQATHTLSRSQFAASLREQIAADKNKAVLVYIHGCFTDFGRGVGYGAYILRGLEFQGPMVVYSWPTVGRPDVRQGLAKAVELYRKDEGTCKGSAQQLKDLLKFLSKDLGAESVHVIAYSMGARTLVEALRLFEPEDDLPVTSHLYFIAPDVAAHYFSETLRDFRFPRLGRVHAKDERPNPPSSSTSDGRGQSEGGEGTACEQGLGGRGGADGDGNGMAAPVSRDGSGGASAAMDTDGTSAVDGTAILHDMVERVADAWNFVGDSVAGLRQLAQAWREARMTGWQEMQEHIFEHWEDREGGSGAAPSTDSASSTSPGAPERSAPGNSPETAGSGCPPANRRKPMRNAHVHLYAAQNDIALLLSELTDPGVPKIRAGRTTKDFMLCNDFINTVDVTSLKTGLLTTGHFYLFHDVVKEEMAHVLSGRQGDAWWRQGMEWENGGRYIRLRAIHPAKLAQVRSGVQAWKASSECRMEPKVDTPPLYWASP